MTRPAGKPASGEQAKLAELLARRRDDDGWSGHFHGRINSATPSNQSLSLSARVAAHHANGVLWAEGFNELLNDARLTVGVWSDADPLVNALGLLAIVTHLNGSPAPACTNDSDCDGTLDDDDAFPHDAEWSDDQDGDGIGDAADLDIDGDGVPNSEDHFPNDPTRTRDSDGDGIADEDDPDLDGDGID